MHKTSKAKIFWQHQLDDTIKNKFGSKLDIISRLTSAEDELSSLSKRLTEIDKQIKIKAIKQAFAISMKPEIDLSGTAKIAAKVIEVITRIALKI